MCLQKATGFIDFNKLNEKQKKDAWTLKEKMEKRRDNLQKSADHLKKIVDGLNTGIKNLDDGLKPKKKKP